VAWWFVRRERSWKSRLYLVSPTTRFAAFKVHVVCRFVQGHLAAIPVMGDGQVFVLLDLVLDWRFGWSLRAKTLRFLAWVGLNTKKIAII
jgi:hypothetical protein